MPVFRRLSFADKNWYLLIQIGVVKTMGDEAARIKSPQ
jgi:hypothetical protein